MTRPIGFALLVATTLACQPNSRAEPEAPASVIEPYLAIGSILAADQTAGLDERGAELAAAARADPNLASLATAAAQLGDLELEPARASYREISHDLLPYLDANPEPREGLTLAYCPMTFANQGGYWLQRGEPLLNPYEGSRMLHCGASLTWEQGVAHRARWAAAHPRAANQTAR